MTRDKQAFRLKPDIVDGLSNKSVPGRSGVNTAGICRNNIGQYCWKECLRRMDDYVSTLEPHYSEAAIICDIRGTVQQRTKYITNLPDWRAFMDNHQREILLAKGKSR